MKSHGCRLIIIYIANYRFSGAWASPWPALYLDACPSKRNARKAGHKDGDNWRSWQIPFDFLSNLWPALGPLIGSVDCRPLVTFFHFFPHWTLAKAKGLRLHLVGGSVGRSVGRSVFLCCIVLGPVFSIQYSPLNVLCSLFCVCHILKGHASHCEWAAKVMEIPFIKWSETNWKWRA